MPPQPLAGLRIVNTRASRQAPALTRLCTREGAAVLHYPAIEIVPCAASQAFDAALNALAAGRFDWLVITSANTALALADRLRALGVDPAPIARTGTRVAAIGPATAAALRDELQLRADFAPLQATTQSLAAELPVGRGRRVLLPQSDIARAGLAQALRASGADVTSVTAYRTVVGRGGDDLPQLLCRGKVDAITFTSASTVHNFVRRLKAERHAAGDGRDKSVPRPPLLPSRFPLADAAVICIGPVTAEAARSHRFHVRVVAAPHTVEGLVHSMKAYFAAARAFGAGFR